MSSWRDKIDPAIVELITKTATEIAKWFYETIKDKLDPDHDAAKAIKIYEDALIEQQSSVLIGMISASQVLAENANEIMRAMREAEKSPTVPVLDINIETVDKIDKP